MFYDAQLFDQPIHSWNVSRVSSFDEMFEGALAFNRPLATWDTREVNFFALRVLSVCAFLTVNLSFVGKNVLFHILSRCLI